MKQSRLVLLFILISGLLSGCQGVPANKPAVTFAPPPPTSLVITVEGDGMTEEQYKARRDELIAYLIERGYIASEDDLVAESAAGRLIRATFGVDGGFKLSVYSLTNEATSEPAVIADYSAPADIPASYYGDYYYYGFAPIPFYGYSSWPDYYPIYPTYPVCLPPPPIAPYCGPAGHYHHNPFPKPTPYVYCNPQPKAPVRWAWQQPNNNWSNHHRYIHGNSDGYHGGGRSTVRPEFASATGMRPVNSTANARTPNDANRYRNHSSNPQVPPAGNNTAAAGDSTHNPHTVPAPTTARTRPVPNQPTAHQNVRPYSPDRRPEGSANRPTVPNTARNSSGDQGQPRGYPRATNADNRPSSPRTTAPDNRPTPPYTARNSSSDQRPPSVYPRANNADNRTPTARPNAPDNRSRNYTPAPERNNAPRPANVANNTRPAPSPAPRSAPPPQRSESSNHSNSSSSSSSSNSHTTSSTRDSSSIRSPVER